MNRVVNWLRLNDPMPIGNVRNTIACRLLFGKIFENPTPQDIIQEFIDQGVNITRAYEALMDKFDGEPTWKKLCG